MNDRQTGMRAKFVLLAVAATTAAAACHPAQRRAETAIAEARYPDALLELVNLEARLDERPPRWQARYSLERGLAHLAVGDATSAAHWLGLAWAWHEYDPLLLTPCERSRLVTAWRAMGQMPGERLHVVGVAGIAQGPQSEQD